MPLKLPKKFADLVNNFTTSLKGIYKEGLVSVVLYGSAASGDFSPDSSNINLLVILEDASLSNLHKIKPLLNKRQNRILNALFFTAGYMTSSADVFPIEFLDMKENSSLIYGKDLLKGLEVDIKNLRLQCEQELKAKVINIKRLYLKNRVPSALSKLLFKSFNSSLHILRNIVRLRKGFTGYSKEEIIKDLSREFRFKQAVLEKIMEFKSGGIKLSLKELDGLFFEFVGELEKASEILDRM